MTNSRRPRVNLAPRRRTVALGLAGAVVAVPLLSACQPNQAGSAAIVGSTGISTTALTQRVNASLAVPSAKQQIGSDRAAFERRVLTLMIDHKLITDAARKQGVSVSTADVNARYAAFVKQAGGADQLAQQGAAAGIPGPDIKGYVGDLELADKLAAKLTASQPVDPAKLQAAYRQNFVQVHAAHILVKSKALADRILAEVKKNPSRFAALAKKYSIDTGSKTKGGDLGTTSPGQYVSQFADAVSTAKPGSFVEVHSQFGWHVIHVISRTASKTLAEATPELRQQLLQQSGSQLVAQLLSKESTALGITVNPRFGTWNATRGEVQAPTSPVSSPGKGSSSGAASSDTGSGG